MASPPNIPTSPPHSLSLPASKKRPASFSTGAPGSNKRRNLSTSVSNSHPLRQTSFPPPEQDISNRATPFSPIVDEYFTGQGSVTGSSVGGEKKRKGRKRRDADTRSIAGRSVSGAKVSNTHIDGKDSLLDGTGEPKDDDEPDEEEGDVNLDIILEDGGQMDEAALKQEKEHLAMLMGAFNPEQADRYDIWRRVRLKKETVRKITNQTLSQSVPASIVTTINGYTKLFIGDIIERAREVQHEWLTASGHFQTAQGDSLDDKYVSQIFKPSTKFTKSERGPLTSAHLREALRRYKKDKEGGGLGYHGISFANSERTPVACGGRRIFK